MGITRVSHVTLAHHDRVLATGKAFCSLTFQLKLSSIHIYCGWKAVMIANPGNTHAAKTRSGAILDLEVVGSIPVRVVRQ